MFKDYFTHNKLSLRPESEDKAEKDRAAVFARLGMEVTMKKDSQHISENNYNNSEPIELYPHKTSPWKRVVPAVAAAAALAVAIPVGVNALGKRAEVSAPASSVEGTAEEAYVTAFRDHFEKNIQSARAAHPDENIAADIPADYIAANYVPLELEAENNGFKITLHGILYAGRGSFYAYYDYEADPETVGSIGVYADCGGTMVTSDCIYDVQSSGSNIAPIFVNPLRDDSVSASDTLNIIFSPRYGENDAEKSYEFIVDKLVNFEIPADFNALPEKTALDENGKLTKFSRFMCDMNITRATDEFDDFNDMTDAVRAVMRDGSVCYGSYQINVGGKETSGGFDNRVVCFWDSPVDINEVARIEAIYRGGETVTVYENTSSDIEQAFGSYFRIIAQSSRSVYPYENISLDVNVDDIAEYYRPLELEAENNGLRIKLYGVLDAGHGMNYAYFDYEFEDGDDHTAMLSLYSDDAGILGGGHTWIGVGGGSAIAPIPFDLEDDLGRQTVKLAFAPDYDIYDGLLYGALGGEPAEVSKVMEEKCVAFDIPVNYSKFTLRGSMCDSDGAAYSVEISPFSIYIETDGPALHNGNIRIVYKDGTVYRPIEAAAMTDAENRTKGLFCFDGIVSADDIELVEIRFKNGDATTIYRDHYDTEPDSKPSEPAEPPYDEEIARYMYDYKPMTELIMFNGENYSVNEHGTVTESNGELDVQYDNTFKATGLKVTEGEDGMPVFTETDDDPDLWFFTIELDDRVPNNKIAYIYNGDGDVRLVLGDAVENIHLNDNEEGWAIWNTNFSSIEWRERMEKLAALRETDPNAESPFAELPVFSSTMFFSDVKIGGDLSRHVIQMCYLPDDKSESAHKIDKWFINYRHIFKCSDGTYRLLLTDDVDKLDETVCAGYGAVYPHVLFPQ